MLSLPELNAAAPEEAIVDVADGVALTRRLPASRVDHWRDWVGSLRFDDVADAGHYLVVYARSAAPGILDAENEVLRRRLLRIHTGLLVAVPYIGHGEAYYLTGGNATGETEVRSLTTYRAVLYTMGSPASSITRSKLQTALSFADALERLEGDGERSARVPRILNALRAGLYTDEMDVRVHQFVRCAEGFLGSDNAGQFRERASQIVEGDYAEVLWNLYAIRSATEHLRGPLHAIGDEQTPTWEKHIILLQRAVQAETLARYLLHVFLSRPDLWPHFHDKASIDAFWRGPEKARRALWGSRLDLAGALREFDVEHVRERLSDE